MHALLSIALNNVVVATLLAAIVAVLARRGRSPVVRHALWLLVLLKLITPPLMTLSIPWPSAEDAESSRSAIDFAQSPAVSANGRRQPAGDTLDPPAGETLDPPAGETLDPPAGETLDPPTDAGRSPHAFAELWMPLLLAVWLGGSFLWWTVAVVRLRRFQRLLRQARPAAAEVQEQARRLAALLGVRRCPPVVFVSAPLSPMLWAIGLSPRLLLPRELWVRLEKGQQDTLLAHELAHLRRGDHWVRYLELLVLGMYWWHPVVWWARRRLQEAEEECCDALVIAVLPDDASAYASALVQTVAFLSQSRAALLVGASGAGQVPLLKRRLTMILMTTSPRRPSRLAFWMVLGLGALLLPLAPGAARTEAPEKAQGVEEKSQSESSGLRLPLANSQPKPLALDFGFPVAKPQEKPRADEMRNCIACHQAQTVHGHDFQSKPQSWRHAHDEVVRLMDEVRRRQAQLREATNNLPAAAAPDRSEEIENLKDEIELLRLKVKLKEAQLRSTKSVSAEARRRADMQRETNKRAPNAIPLDTIMEMEINAKKLEAEAEVKEVELRESVVRLKQAERRLARLHRPAEKTEGGGREQQDKRMRELEQKVESLLKEIQKMRRDMDPKKTKSPQTSTKDGKDDPIWRQLGLLVSPVEADDVKKMAPPFRGGLMATKIRSDSPAERASLHKGDILVGLDKYEVLSEENVRYIIALPALSSKQQLEFYCLRGGQLLSGKFALKDMRPSTPRDPALELKEARTFIDSIWSTIDTTRLEDNIPKARNAFQQCKDAGDRYALQRLLTRTKGHANWLAKELSELRPDIISDDVAPAKKLQKMNGQILKLSQDIEDYLKAHPDDK